MDIIIFSVFLGGAIYTFEDRGFLGAIVWPLALGMALARFTAREIKLDEKGY